MTSYTEQNGEISQFAYGERDSGDPNSIVLDSKSSSADKVSSSSISKGIISTSKLYPVDFEGLKVRRMMHLVAKAVELCEESRSALQNGDVVNADNTILFLHPMLTELFLLREIGDGFGAAISSLMNVFENHATEPFSLSQLDTILKVLTFIKENPRMSFDQALDLDDFLEEAGLNTEAPLLKHIVDWLE